MGPFKTTNLFSSIHPLKLCQCGFNIFDITFNLNPLICRSTLITPAFNTLSTIISVYAEMVRPSVH